MERIIRQEIVAVLREGYFRLTGDVTGALILNQLIYWSKRVSDFEKFMQEENNRRKLEGDEEIKLTFGWIHKTATQLKEEIMSDDSRMTIQRKIDSLVKKGYLERRNNPNHAYDRTYQYRVNLLKICDDLNALGYQLEGFKIETVKDDNSTQRDNAQAELSNAQNEQCKTQPVHSNAQYELWNAHSVQAIPETTTEIISKTTSSSSYSLTQKSKTFEDDEKEIGEVSNIINAMELSKLAHKDMTVTVKTLLSEMLKTGKVGKNTFSPAEIKKSLGSLKPSDIDNVINRYLITASSGEIKSSENFLKVCLFSQGRTNTLTTIAKRTGATGIHCGNPSFNIEEYSRMSIDRLMKE